MFRSVRHLALPVTVCILLGGATGALNAETPAAPGSDRPLAYRRGGHRPAMG